MHASETELKVARRTVIDASSMDECIVETVRGPLVLTDSHLRVISADRSFFQTFKVAPEDTGGQVIYDIVFTLPCEEF